MRKIVTVTWHHMRSWKPYTRRLGMRLHAYGMKLVCDHMWSHVISRDLMWSHVISCDLTWSHVISCEVITDFNVELQSSHEDGLFQSHREMAPRHHLLALGGRERGCLSMCVANSLVLKNLYVLLVKCAWQWRLPSQEFVLPICASIRDCAMYISLQCRLHMM